MPKAKQPRSLEHWSLHSVTKNLTLVVRYYFNLRNDVPMEVFFTTSDGQKFLEKVFTREFQENNPFEAIPHCYLRHLEEASRRSVPKPGLLTPFIETSQFTELRIHQSTPESYLQHLNTQHALRFRVLKWVASLKPSLEILEKFQSLWMIQANLDDERIGIISKSNPQLRSLETFCEEVSDKGLELLIKLKFFETLKPPAKCPKISKSGIKFLFANIPTLQKVESWDTVEILSEIYEDSLLSKDGEILQFKNVRSLNFARCHLVGSSLKMAAETCPRLTRVTLSKIENLADRDLQFLLQIDKLEALTVRLLRKHSPSVNFKQGIIPLLEKHGTHLKVLSFLHIRGVCVGCINYYCIKLKTLQLHDCSFAEELPSQLNIKNFNEVWQSELKSVSVRNVLGRADLPMKHWKILLNSPELESIDLEGTFSVNDSLLSEILVKNSLPKLKDIRLVSVKNLTTDSLWKFLKLSNPLKTIYYRNDNRGLSKEEVHNLFEFSINLDVTLNLFWDL